MQIDSIRFYEYSSYSWQKVFLTIYNYDDFGKLEYLVSQKWNGNKWENNIKLQIDTLKYGQQINETFYDWDNNEWIKFGRVIYYYDNDKYFHHAHCEYWLNDTWVSNIDGIHVYNPDGFEIHYLTHELNIYYEQPTSVKGENSNLIIDEFELYQNYPNPFNPTTVIKYSIPNNTVIAFRQPTEKQSAVITSVNSFPHNDNMNVKLVVYDILGREITTLVNEEKKPGTYEVIFDSKDLPSGLYFYRLQSGEFIKTKKMLLLK
ncbi:MAG: T9SS type A sorting domain-containing protein [Ignavibacteriales bacterium]|nr:T9SS type A sorting domain-containing protein [Ignavibacteriales bacterium]